MRPIPFLFPFPFGPNGQAPPDRTRCLGWGHPDFYTLGVPKLNAQEMCFVGISNEKFTGEGGDLWGQSTPICTFCMRFFCGKLTNPFSSFSKDIHPSLQNLLFEVRDSGPTLIFLLSFCPMEFQENVFIHDALLDGRREHPGSQVQTLLSG